MNELDFKTLANASNFESFPSLLFERQLSRLRQDIFEFLLSRKSEDDYIDLTDIKKLNSQKVFEKVFQELTEMGWKFALGFGETGLFIYKENKPITCW